MSVVIFCSLFDVSGTDGIARHAAEILNGIQNRVKVDEIIYVLKSASLDADVVLPTNVGGADISYIKSSTVMSLAVPYTLLTSVLLGQPFDFGGKIKGCDLIFVGYHWVFWLPFISGARSVIYVPFDVWSTREAKIASKEARPGRSFARNIWSSLIRLFERLSASRVDLAGFVSEAERVNYISSIVKPAQKYDIRTSLLPARQMTSVGVRRAVSDRSKIRVTVWMDCRVNFGLRSVVECVEQIARVNSRSRNSIELYLLTKLGNDEIQKSISHIGQRYTNVPFVDDIDEFLSQTDVLILPDIVGSGVKNRIIQGASAQCVLIATKSAVEGIDNLSAQDLFLATDIYGFDNAIEDVLSNWDIAVARSIVASKKVGDYISSQSGEQFYKEMEVIISQSKLSLQ